MDGFSFTLVLIAFGVVVWYGTELYHWFVKNYIESKKLVKETIRFLEKR